MEMGKHIIIFITAILMPFMAYGADCSGLSKNTCDTRPGCEWIVDELSGIRCDPCGYGTYNTGGDDSRGCTQCTNAPAGCGTNGSSCDWIRGEAYTGLTSNDCPWQLTCNENQEYDETNKGCANCTPGFYNNNNNPTYIYNGKEVIGPECSAKTFKIKLEYKIDDTTYTPKDDHPETVTVSKTETKLSVSAQSYEQTLRNQYDYGTATLSYNNMSCTMEYDKDSKKFVLKNDKCDTLNAPNDAELTLTLMVTAKNFQYVLVPMNSVPDKSGTTFNLIKNTYEYRDSVNFGTNVSLPTDVTYYQYNNCTYDKTNSTVNCQFTTAPTTPSDTINYEFEYSDDTIIVLEQHCPADSYCSDYKTILSCPDAFSSAKDSAISETDCYLDSSVTFVDKNGSKNLITGENTKVYYRGNSNK